MSILQPFSALEKTIKNSGSRKKIFKIKFIDDVNIEKTKNQLSDFTSSAYKNWKAISDGTQEAKSSFDAYVASCISGHKKLSAEGYKDFLNQNIGQYSSVKGGAQQVLDKYKELNDAVVEAEANVSKSQAAISAFTNPDIDDDGYIQVKKSLEENEDALHKAKMAYDDFDNAVAAGNPDLAEFAKQGNLGAGAGKKFEKASRSVTAAEIARAAGHTLANAALSFGLSVLLQLVSTGFMALINADKEAIEKANELGEEYKKTNEELSDHTEKIKELKDAIASGTLTDAESYDKKKELLEIQNELYNSYGKQAEGIDLVNGKYDEEIAKLREINRQKAQEALNNGGYAGEKAAKQTLNKTRNNTLDTVLNIGGVGNPIAGIINTILDYTSDYSLGLSTIFADHSSDVYKGIYSKIIELGGKIDQDSGVMKFEDKTTEEMIAVYDELIAYVNENFDAQDKHVQNWLSTLSKRRGKLNSDEYTNAQKVLEDTALQRIATNDEAYEYYNQIQQAIADYNEAVISGDTEAIAEEATKLAALKDGINDIEEAANNKNVADYFNNMFASFNQDVGMAQLKGAITRGNNVNGSVWNQIVNQIQGKNDVETKAFFDSLSNDSREKQVLDMAEEMFGVNLDDIINAFVELGIIEGTVTDTTDITTTSFTTLVEQLEEAKTAITKFDDALSKVSIGDVLSENEVNDLLAIDPSLLGSIERVANGYVIAYDKISEAREKLVEKQREDVSAEIAENNKEKNRINKEISDLINNKNSTEAHMYRIKDNLDIRNRNIKGILKPYKNDIDEFYKNAEQWQIEYYEDQIYYRDKDIAQLKEKYNIEYDVATIDSDIVEYSDKINTEIDERKNKIEDINAETAQYKFLLEQIEDPIENWAERLNSVADSITSLTDKIITMQSQMAKTGKIDPTTALDFIMNVPNYSDYITIGEDGVVLNDLSDNSMLELIKLSTGYNDVTKEMTAIIDKNITERDKQQQIVDSFYSNLEKNGKTTEDEAKAMVNAQNRVSQLDDEITHANGTLEDTEKLLLQILKLFQIDEATQAFNDAVDDIDHQLAMDDIDDRAYSKAFDTYVKNLETAVANGNSKAQATLDSAKEKQLSLWKSLEQDDYDDEKTELDNQLEDNLISYLEYQKKLKAINEKYYGANSNNGKGEDGKEQYAANLREIEKLNSEIFNDITSRFQSAIDFGKIIDPNIINDLADVFKGQELPDAVAQVIKKGIETGIWNATDLATIAPYLTEALLAGSDVNSEAYQNAIVQQKDYIVSAFEYEKTQLENKLNDGSIIIDNYLSEYENLWRKYYKDKKEMAEEDYQTQKDLLEAYKNAIQQQIDALNYISEELSKPYQNEIDDLNEVKDKYDEVMDDKIKNLQKQKDAIEKANQKQKEENELLEKKQALEKASIKNRLVYTGNGRWEARRDEEEYKNAKEEYDDALKQAEIDKIDEQIEAINSEKEARDDAIDEEIKAREQQIKEITRPIDDLITILTTLMMEEYNLDPKFIGDLLSTEEGQKAFKDYKERLDYINGKAAEYGVAMTGTDKKTSEEIVDELKNWSNEFNKNWKEILKAFGIEDTSSSETSNTNSNTPNTQDVITSGNNPENSETTQTTSGTTEAASEVASTETVASEKCISIDKIDTATIQNIDTLKFVQAMKDMTANGTTIASNSLINQADVSTSKIPDGVSIGTISNSITINNTIQGNADKSTIDYLNQTMTQRLNEYTDYMTSSFTKAINKKIYS